MTLLLGFVTFLAYSIVQGLGLLPWVLVRAAAGASPRQLQEAAMVGMNLAFATLLGCPACLLFVGFLVRARQGPSLEAYLALRRVSWRVLAGWVFFIAVVAGGMSKLNDVIGRPPPDFVVSTYASAGYLPLLWAAIGVCGPVAEEVLFRGFLFGGLAASRLGTKGALLVVSVLFALVHGAQYGWYDLVQVGFVGLLFGLARVRTGSLLVSIGMHVTLNLVALALYQLEGYSGL